MQPDGFVAAAHVHPAQTERFEILEGTIRLRLGRETVVLSPGEVAVVPAGTPHRFWNTGDTEARFLCEVRPALRFESLMKTMFTLAAEGKTGAGGLPGPLQLAVVAGEHFDTVRLPSPPAPLQCAVLAVGAPLGRLRGCEATIPQRRYDRGRPHFRPVSGGRGPGRAPGRSARTPR